MNHTTPTTWHDLADQLTADQRARLAAAEDMPAAERLAMARHWADYAQLQADLAAVPAPAGATRCSSWFRDGDEGPTRAAYGQRWIFGGGSVEMSCDQTADGSIGPWRVEVAVDQLMSVAEPVSNQTQADFLRAHGIDDLVEEGAAKWREQGIGGGLEAIAGRSRVHEAEALLDPTGLGAFRVLEWEPGPRSARSDL